MENKAIIVTIINGLLATIVAYKEWGFYILDGWKTETIITVAVGAIVGAIIAAKQPPKKAKTWTILAATVVVFVVLYSTLLDRGYSPVWLILIDLLLLLGISITLSCILAYFELEIVKLFSDKKKPADEKEKEPKQQTTS